MKKCIVITHCKRADFGGEDVALDKISNFKVNASLNIYDHDKNVVYCMLKFVFSLSYVFFVLRNRDKRHIVCNPFPSVSLLSILLLSLLRIPLRVYVHNFSLTCIGGTNYLGNKCCETYKKEKYCLNFGCCRSTSRYLLNFTRYFLFYKMFSLFRKNKIYFVSEYQAKLALQAGLVRKNYIIAGNID
jgi:hypothetical protein